MSVIGTAPVLANACRLSRPGTRVTIASPGLKPSERFMSVGSIGLPATLRGMPSGGRFSRLPVGVLGSEAVK